MPTLAPLLPSLAEGSGEALGRIGWHGGLVGGRTGGQDLCRQNGLPPNPEGMGPVHAGRM